MNRRAHWEKILPGFSILQWDTIDMEEKEMSTSWLGLGTFSWESRVDPWRWRKALLCVFPFIWAFVNCATLFFVLFFFINTWFNFCSLDFFFNQPSCQEKMNHRWKCSFFQEYNFGALCASIFVEIQKVWFSIDGLFLRDVFCLIL